MRASIRYPCRTALPPHPKPAPLRMLLGLGFVGGGGRVRARENPFAWDVPTGGQSR